MSQDCPTCEECRVDTTSRLTAIETSLNRVLNNDLPHITTELSLIRESLAKTYRPPWSVTIIVTMLSSAVVGLLVLLMK